MSHNLPGRSHPNTVSPEKSADDSELRRSKHRKNKHKPREVEDEDSDTGNTGLSGRKTPSIIGLKNLHYDFASDEQHKIEQYAPGKRYRPQKELNEVFSYASTHRPRTTVYLKVVFLKIGSIETVDEEYSADIFLQAKWREPALDGNEKPVKDFTKLWNPLLVIQNIKGETKQETWHEVHRDRYGKSWLIERRRVSGKFQETMELHYFPFDIQDISIIISSDLSRESLEFVEDTNELSVMRVDQFSDRQEWEMYEFVEFDPMEISSEFSKDSHAYPGMAVRGTVSRRPGFFAYNVLLIVTLINLLSFTTFAVDVGLTQNRLQLSFILILSSISFRFVTNQNIPKISYLTNLDRYILLSMVFAIMVTFWHAGVSRFDYDKNLQETLDFWAFIVALGVFCAFQFVYVIVMIVLRLLKDRRMTRKQDLYTAKAKRLMGDHWETVRLQVRGITAFKNKRKKDLGLPLDLFR